MKLKEPLTDIEIARYSRMLPIEEVAEKLEIPEDCIERFGKYKAKIELDFCRKLEDQSSAKLILVSSINPTPTGEGKTTTSVGLVDGLNRIGKRATVCLREPSLGPCFGMKGGAAGGGYAQVVPMEDINLHFNGDFHAISTAHNLLAALTDNHIHQGNKLDIDPRRIEWNRVIDMNDRALRKIVLGLGGPANSIPRESGFDIAVASEVMAIFCLSESLKELRQRLGRIIVAHTRDKKPVNASQLKAEGAMSVLLKDALQPNLVQTLENNPAIIHGGPFANIAHGCNSVIATKVALGLSDYVVTEAGFGADLGAEKFFNIKCRQSGLEPDAVVLVVTVRALKYHGGMELKELTRPDPVRLEKGIENLKKHIENIRAFGLTAVVAINSFTADTDDEINIIHDKCAHLGVEIVQTDHWKRGGGGAENLAHAVVRVAEGTKNDFSFLYEDDMPLWDKVKRIAKKVYGANDIMGDKQLRDKFSRLQREGYGNLPVCIAKTQYSLSTDPGLRGQPSNFDIPIRDVKLAAGAGFIVVLTGNIMTMPGLPKKPSAELIDLDDHGKIVGMF